MKIDTLFMEGKELKETSIPSVFEYNYLEYEFVEFWRNKDGLLVGYIVKNKAGKYGVITKNHETLIECLYTDYKFIQKGFKNSNYLLFKKISDWTIFYYNGTVVSEHIVEVSAIEDDELDSNTYYVGYQKDNIALLIDEKNHVEKAILPDKTYCVSELNSKCKRLILEKKQKTESREDYKLCDYKGMVLFESRYPIQFTDSPELYYVRNFDLTRTDIYYKSKKVRIPVGLTPVYVRKEFVVCVNRKGKARILKPNFESKFHKFKDVTSSFIVELEKNKKLSFGDDFIFQVKKSDKFVLLSNFLLNNNKITESILWDNIIILEDDIYWCIKIESDHCISKFYQDGREINYQGEYKTTIVETTIGNTNYRTIVSTNGELLSELLESRNFGIRCLGDELKKDRLFKDGIITLYHNFYLITDYNYEEEQRYLLNANENIEKRNELMTISNMVELSCYNSGLLINNNTFYPFNENYELQHELTVIGVLSDFFIIQEKDNISLVDNCEFETIKLASPIVSVTYDETNHRACLECEDGKSILIDDTGHIFK